MPILISTPRLLLRQVREEDISGVHMLMNQESVLRWLPQLKMNYEQVKNYLYAIGDQYVVHPKEDCNMIHACIEKGTNQFIGLVFVTSHVPIQGDAVIIACMLDSVMNKGFATEAIDALTHCVLERLHFDCVTAIFHVNHVIAQRVAEKCGYKNTAILLGTELKLDNDQPYYYYKRYKENKTI